MKTKILSWNVNGLRAVHKKDSLNGFKLKVQIYYAFKKQKLQKNNSRALKSIEGYHAYFCEAEKKGYSGVAIYSKTKPKQ